MIGVEIKNRWITWRWRILQSRSVSTSLFCWIYRSFWRISCFRSNFLALVPTACNFFPESLNSKSQKDKKTKIAKRIYFSKFRQELPWSRKWQTILARNLKNKFFRKLSLILSDSSLPCACPWEKCKCKTWAKSTFMLINSTHNAMLHHEKINCGRNEQLWGLRTPSAYWCERNEIN